MVDYYRLLTDAVAGLGDQNTADRRRDLFDRGRALIAERFGTADTRARAEITAFEKACVQVETQCVSTKAEALSAVPAARISQETGAGNDTKPLKYRAFLSYSHADTEVVPVV